MVVWRSDQAPRSPSDPVASSRKVTNTRYDLDGGVELPPDRPLYVAVYGCRRDGSRLLIAPTVPSSARLTLTS
jgi:hypothetical protein